MSVDSRENSASKLLAAVLGLSVGVISICVGCSEAAPPAATSHRGSGAGRERATTEALRSAIALLGDENFDADQALTQAASRLNQWLIARDPDATWTADPLVKTLPEEYREGVADRTYDVLEYHKDIDGSYLRQNIWLNQISATQLERQPSDLELGERLFDWTIRNIQLQPAAKNGETSKPAQSPWRVLMTGQGTAIERAWIFLLLAKQQHLDGFIVHVASADATQPDRWLPALLIDGEAYLFDTELGVSIPSPEGKGIATLKQAAADDSLLRQLDVDGRPYPVASAQLQQPELLLEASPQSISRRMQLVESQLGSDQPLVLTSDPSGQAKRLNDAGFEKVALWRVPYDALVREVGTYRSPNGPLANDFPLIRLSTPGPLRKARLLHFRGHYEGEPPDDGAKQFYMQSRLSEAELTQLAEEHALNALMIQRLTDDREDASYWLGLVTFEEGEFGAAVEHLKTRSLKEYPNGRWTTGARYNLARALEASGKPEEAIALYRTKGSPQDHGNQLRAKWLEEGKLKSIVQ